MKYGRNGKKSSLPSKLLQLAGKNRGFVTQVKAWFRRARRPMPWRNTRDPYRIWVSEIMLQQTRAAAVVPYYEKFLRRFPTVAALARSREADLLECWSGLGYYARARNLRRAAGIIVSRLAGKLPRIYQQWVELPGVGPYTAAAVTSIAFGAPVAVMDGNVARLMARLTGNHGDVGSARVRDQLRERAQELMDPRDPGEFNQAMMELGATVCTPRQPRCLVCPVQGWCSARRLGIENELPVKGRGRGPVRMRILVALVQRAGRLLLGRRPADASLLPGFWELPQVETEGLSPDAFASLRLELLEPLGEFRHSITYREYLVTVYRAALGGRPPRGYQWVEESRLSGLPLTTIARKALRCSLPVSVLNRFGEAVVAHALACSGELQLAEGRG